MTGGGSLTLTGQLGDVMKESARAALSWVRAHANEWQIDPDFFKNSETARARAVGRDSERRSVGRRDDGHRDGVGADPSSGARRTCR